MDFDGYDILASKTDISGKALWYYALGLSGEAGEFAEKVKKIYRDKGGNISEEDRQLLLKELGDITWYKSRAAKYLGSSSEQVAVMNIQKLRKRVETDTISGSGDNREEK